MGFSAAGSADENQIGTFVDSAVAGTDRHRMGLGDRFRIRRTRMRCDEVRAQGEDLRRHRRRYRVAERPAAHHDDPAANA